MKKSDIFKAIVVGAAKFLPSRGAGKTPSKIPAIKVSLNAGHAASDPNDDDPDTIAEALAAIVIGSVPGAGTVTAQEFIQDPVLAQLIANILGDLKLAQLVLARKAAGDPARPPGG